MHFCGLPARRAAIKNAWRTTGFGVLDAIADIGRQIRRLTTIGVRSRCTFWYVRPLPSVYAKTWWHDRRTGTLPNTVWQTHPRRCRVSYAFRRVNGTVYIDLKSKSKIRQTYAQDVRGRSAYACDPRVCKCASNRTLTFPVISRKWRCKNYRQQHLRRGHTSNIFFSP